MKQWVLSECPWDVEAIYGGFCFVMGVPPNHPVVMDDHDLVLKPMVTLGSLMT